VLCDGIATRIARLDLSPRDRQWTSLSYCVVDAIWSINARYESVVARLVRRVAVDNGDDQPVVDPSQPAPLDPLPLPELLKRYPEPMTLRSVANSQLTSPRGGITKAEAVLRYARVLVEHEIVDLTAAQALLAVDDDRWAQVNAELAKVPGEGHHGVRRGYLWMLCGDDHTVKPDRMILRWLARQGAPVTAGEARQVLHRAAEELTQQLARPITPWMIDHAIWKAERGRL